MTAPARQQLAGDLLGRQVRRHQRLDGSGRADHCATASSARGTGHMSGLLVDSNGTVSGSVGGLTATANSTSSRGVSFSVVLH